MNSWIEQAIIGGGGRLEVKRMMSGQMVAIMNWPACPSIYSDATGSIDAALSDLDRKLCDDAADEMVRKGAA